jgi:tetratricopeptide (TPR) repeat protein/WD40 repeat protein
MTTATESLSDRLDRFSEEERRVILREYPEQLAVLADASELSRLLTSFGFLSRKLRAFGIDAVVEDFAGLERCAPADEAPWIRAVLRALRRAAPALRENPDEFAAQLVGRMMAPGLALPQPLRGEAERAAEERGLRPLLPTLAQGSTAAANILEAREPLKFVIATRDGSQLVTGSRSGELVVWRLPLGVNTRRSVMHCPGLTALCVTPDDRSIVTAAQGGILVRWELASGFEVCRRTISALEHVAQLQADEHGTLYALVREGIAVLDVETLAFRGVVGLEAVECFAAVGPGLLLTGTGDGCIDLVDVARERRVEVGWHGGYKTERMTGAEFAARLMMSSPLYGMAGGEIVSTDMREVAAGHLGLSEEERRELMGELRKDPLRHTVMAMAVDADATPCASSASGSGELVLIDLAAGAVGRRFRGAGRVRCCALSASRGWVVTGADDGAIIVWNMDTGTQIRRLAHAGPAPVGVVFAEGGTRIVAALADGRLISWSAAEIHAGGDDFAAAEPVRALSVIDGQVFAVLASGVVLRDHRTGAQLARYSLPDAYDGRISLTPDGRRALSTKGCVAVVWDLATGWPLHRLQGEWALERSDVLPEPWTFQDAVLTSDLRWMLSFATPGVLAAMAANHGRVEVWDVTVGRVAHVLDHRAGHVQVLAVSPDGRWGAVIAARAAENEPHTSEVRVWELATGRLVHEVREAEAGCLAFSADSRSIWWRAGSLLRRLWMEGHAAPEQVAAPGAAWSRLVPGAGGRAVAVAAGDRLEEWALDGPARLATLSLDADVAALALAPGLVVAGDRIGRVHFLRAAGTDVESAQTARALALSRAREVARRMDAPVHERMDAAYRLAASQEAGLALQVWRSLGRDGTLDSGMRTAIARHLAALGDVAQADAVLGAVAADGAEPEPVRLRAVEALHAPARCPALPRMAQAFAGAFGKDTREADIRVFCALVERIAAAGEGPALDRLAADPEIPLLARVAMAQALGRLDRDAGCARLEMFADDLVASGTARVVALEGLRHLAPTARWIDVAARALRSGIGGGRERRAIARMLIRATGAGSIYDFGAAADEAWYDAGLLGQGTELNARALWLAATGDPDGARALLSRASRLEPGNAVLACNQAGILIRLERYAEGIQEATRALQLDREYEKALSFRAYALMQEEEFELALQDLNHALALRPGEPTNLYNRADCLRALARLDEAERDTRDAEWHRALAGKEASGEPFETSRARDPLEAGEADARRAAVEVLRSEGLLAAEAEFIEAAACEPDLPLAARESAIAALGEVEDHAALCRLAVAEGLEPALRVRAAATFLAVPGDAPGGLRRAVAGVLRAVIVDRAGTESLRAEAAHALAGALERDEVLALLPEVPIEPGDGERPGPGVWPVLQLVSPFGSRGDRETLEALARDRRQRGWVREIACEVLGQKLDAASAVQLLEALAEDGPHEPALEAAMKRARRFLAGEMNPSGRVEGHAWQEGVAAFLAAGSVEEVDALAERFPFLSDPEVVEHTRYFARYHASATDRPLLEAKLRRLLELPPNLAQAAWRAFARAGSPGEMRDVAQRLPILTTPAFQETLRRAIESAHPAEDRPALWRRLEWLRALPPDPLQAAIEAFFHADSPQRLREEAARFPVIQTRRFRHLLDQVEVNGDPKPPLEVRLGWLDALGPAFVDQLFDAAQQDLLHDRPEAALEKIARVAQLDPERSLHFLRGCALHAAGQVEQAIEELTCALERHPSAAVLEARGSAYLRLDRFAEALADLNRALELNPDFFEALVGRSFAQSALNNWPAAVADLEHALKLRPEDQFAALQLAGAYPLTGESDRALAILDAVDWDPSYRDSVGELRSMLAGEPRDPWQEAFDAFLAASSEHSLHAAVFDHPTMRHLDFLTELDAYIEGESDPHVRDGLRRRWEALRVFVQNPAQLAYEALLETTSAGEVRQLLPDHPILRNPDFVAHLEQVAADVGPDGFGDPHLVGRVADLRRALAG